jgi:hypothetical protein
MPQGLRSRGRVAVPMTEGVASGFAAGIADGIADGLMASCASAERDIALKDMAINAIVAALCTIAERTPRNACT